MSGVSKLIDDATEQRAIQALKELGKNGVVANKLKAILAAKSHDISMVSKVYNVTRMTIALWIKAFKNEDIAGLIAKPRKSREPRISKDQEAIVEQWIKDDCGITIRQVQKRALEELGVNMSIATAHRVLRRLQFAYITPRPSHYKKDPQKQEEFKKKSTRGGAS
jgi:transposase